jgi:formate hydrogenlyase subunit 3/multisubunit Na+/H+ antiporter MnhD subunit
MPELLLLVPALPIVLAAALALPALRPLAGALAPAAPLPALAAALVAPTALELPWLMLGARFGLDGHAPAFLAFTGLLWVLAALAALAYHRDDPRRTGFLACFLLAMAGNLGLLVAQDAFSFYAFFATMSFAAYGLVVHARDPAALRAGRVYIAFVVAGELALFAGLALAVASAGSPFLADIRATPLPAGVLALLLGGFGIKLGLVPLHLWLPLAHAAAPVAASAVLSGAMIKAGLFGILSFLPLGLSPAWGLGLALMAAGIAAIPLAALLGGLSPSPKAVLAWSSVGQMGLLAIALGAALAAPAAWPAIAPALAFYAAHHALAKGALFLGVGAFLADRSRTWRWITLAALALPAAALAALPLTSGHAAKDALKASLAGAPDLAPWLLPVLAASTAATAILMVRLFLLLPRQAPVPKPRALLAPALAASGLVVLRVPLWPIEPPAPVPPALSLADLALVAAGLAIAAALDAILGRRGRPHAGADRAPAATTAPPARGRSAAAKAGLRLRVAWRHLGQRATAAAAFPSPGAAAAVLVLASMLLLEAWTLVGPPVGGGPEPAATREAPP